MILVVDNYDSFTWNLVLLLRAAGGDGTEVRVVQNDALDLPGLRRLAPSHLVISPGPGAPASSGVSLALARAPFAPLLGVCLGHQCIAAAHGAAVTRAETPTHGKTAEVLHDDALFAPLPQGFVAARYHSLAVDERTVRPPLRVTARSRDGVVMGLRVADAPVVGV
ncbi:MAG: gamma-glutamyl-gamma-aminobutyrate hydrolase family protein [Polyangiales bacterium]